MISFCRFLRHLTTTYIDYNQPEKIGKQIGTLNEKFNHE